MPGFGGVSAAVSRRIWPQAMLGAETPDLIQLDVGILRLRCGGTSDPPVSTGQSSGEVGPGSGLPVLLCAAGMCSDFAVCRLP